MTKAEEITAWRKFAAAMPPAATYSGKWIAEQIAFIESDIRADMPPGYHAASMADARAEWNRAREDADATRAAAADAQAEKIKARATEEAAEILRKARAAADAIRHRALAAIREATRTLEA